MREISIVIPVYNGAKYLSNCIESIIKQTYTNIEVILIDDGSTDLTPCICDKYSQEYSNILVIHTVNGGVSKARNIGFKHSTGDYVIFIDADDYLNPQMLEVLCTNIEIHKADISICNVSSSVSNEHFDINNIQKTFYDHDTALSDFLLGRNIKFGIWTKLFRRELICNLSFMEGYKINEDKYFIFEALLQAKRVVYCNLPLYCYLKREDSVTAGIFSSKWFDIHYFAKKILDRVKVSNDQLCKEAEYQLLVADYSLLNIMYTKNTNFRLYTDNIQEIMSCINSINLCDVKEFLTKKMYYNIFLLKKNSRIYWFLKKLQKVRGIK